MTTEINVISRTQVIVVEPTSGTVAIISAGPVGPGGPPGEVSTSQMNQAINDALAVRGIPSVGLTGQVLAKLSDNDYDIGWVDLP